MIDFEKDQENVLQKTANIQSLADQVENLEALRRSIENQEGNLKELKKKQYHLLFHKVELGNSQYLPCLHH